MSDSAAWPRYSDPDCHYGDHHWVGGACSRCGLQLRCGACGRFVTVEGLVDHIDNACPIKWEVYEEAETVNDSVASTPPITDPQGFPFIVTCKFCKGTGSVPDASQWPPQAVCPGCKGAGVHVLR